jgi:hypothetical protein
LQFFKKDQSNSLFGKSTFNSQSSPNLASLNQETTRMAANASRDRTGEFQSAIRLFQNRMVLIYF